MQRRSVLRLGAAALFAGKMTKSRAANAVSAVPEEPPTTAAAFHAARKFVSLACGRVAYTDLGHGDAALFLHGFPLNAFQWRGAIDRLKAHRRCIAPDFLALGYTEPAAGQAVDPDAQVAMLAALLDHLKVASADLVASDSGGAVAQLFAVRHSKRVRSVLLANCDVEIDSPPPVLKPVLAEAHAGTFGSKMLRSQYDDKKLARSEAAIGGACYTFRANPTDEMINTYLEPLTRNPARCALADAYALGLERNPLAGMEAHLRQLAIPIRLVWGTADDIFPLRDAEYLAKLLPQSRGIRRVEGARLFFPEEFPDLIAAEARGLWGFGKPC